MFTTQIGVYTGLEGEGHAPGAFGDVLMDVEAGVGWGHAVAWSPSGDEMPGLLSPLLNSGWT